MSGMALAFLTLTVFIIAAWVLIFGRSGAIVSESRGASPTSGFVLGAVLGPVGWGVIWYRTSTAVDAAEESVQRFGEVVGAESANLLDDARGLVGQLRDEHEDDSLARRRRGREW